MVAAGSGRLRGYLDDPFLDGLYRAIRAAGPIRSISVDLTNACNIRCNGCYFFSEGMDTHRSDAAAFDAFVEREQARGTNFVTVVGGEPSLALDRLRVLHDRFRINVATNGIRRIPKDGFARLPIGVSVWGDAATDRELRGGGRVDVFDRALANYRNDERAFFYYTVAPGHADQVERVVERCVDNGNRVLFNFYSDLARVGGAFDATGGFGAVRDAIERAIERWPGRIWTTAYLAHVVTTGELDGRRWGHATCTSVTADHPVNRERIANGNPFNPHFRAYNADFSTTRRCCTGVDRDCDTCFDTWEHFSWITLNLRAHLASRAAFTNWLTTTWLFYRINHLVDGDDTTLAEIHRRTRLARAGASA